MAVAKKAAKRAAKKTTKKPVTKVTAPGSTVAVEVYAGVRFEHMVIEAPASQIVDRLEPYGAQGWHVVGMSGPMVLLERSV